MLQHLRLALLLFGSVGIIALSMYLVQTQRHAQAAAVPIITYHAVTAGDPASNSVSISAAQFATQLEQLAANGYTTITMKTLGAYLDWQQLSLPTKPVVLTFDDNDKTQVTTVLPLLQKYDMVATFYIVSGWVGSHPQLLTWEDIHTLHDAGMDIGGHTVTHQEITASTTATTLAQAITQDKRALEEALDREIFSFAFPYNSYSDAAMVHLEQLGYTTGRTSERVTSWQRFAMPSRIATPERSLTQLLQLHAKTGK